MIKLKINDFDMTVKFSTFPGGEEYVKIEGKCPQMASIVYIDARIDSSKEFMRLALLVDALRNSVDKRAEFRLNMPYLPYARQDRICQRGESFSVKVFARMLNALEFDKVYISDCHSDVGASHINNIVHEEQFSCMATSQVTYNLITNADVVIAPDAGAAKKAQAVADFYGKPLIQCLKTRGSDGSIKVKILEPLRGLNAVVVDDICDGGGTFIALAEAIRLQGDPLTLNLCVTHGIFSKGKEILYKLYNEVEGVYEW